MKRLRLSNVAVLAVLLFLYAPILVLVVLSFNDSRFGVDWHGFTLRWYTRLFQSPENGAALVNTLLVSVPSTLVATVLGTLLAIGLDLYNSRARRVVEGLIYTPVVLPDIVMGITTLALYVTIHLSLGRISIILAHIVFQTAFVAMVVRGRIQDFPPAVIEAARDLGASQHYTLRRIILPLLAPGIIMGALVAFALSVDDFVITYFTAGAGTSTLPLRIYSMVKRGVTPDINALSTLMLLFTLMAVLLFNRARRYAPLLIVVLLVAGCARDARTSLNLFTWSDYLDPQIAADFEKAHGVHLNIDYYDTNEAMLAKLKAGGLGQYDVVIASDYAVEIMRRENLLEALDTTALPNRVNIDPRFRSQPADPGNRFSMPYQWGTTGLGVRTDLVKGNPELDTWRVVFDSSYAVGPMTMLSDERETIGAALIYLGLSPNTTDSTELARAEELLRAQRARVTTYAPLANGRDLLVSGDVVVSHNSSGDVMLGKADAPGIKYFIPREGALIWTDNMVIPAKAPHAATALAFINYMLDAHVGARLSDYTKYATPNAAALPFISASLRNDPSIYPDSARMRRLQYLRDVGAARAQYDRIWSRLRAGG